MKAVAKDRFLEIFPVFQKGPEPLVDDILSYGRYWAVPPNTMIQLEGQLCPSIGLMLSGEKRIYKVGNSGREITLYEVGIGETCILNASCILSNTPCPVNVVSTSYVEELLVGAEDFRRFVAKYEEMRSFVFSVMSQSFASVMELITEVAFRRMDERLVDYLIEKSEDLVLLRTHQQIASDLGTAREVVSRLLKDFERKELIKLSRNRIELTNLQGLV